jgi:hypothetical protein
MNTLSLNRVTAVAPAAASRRNAGKEGLIDTTAFLKHIRTAYGMTAGVAVQGKRHEDASPKTKAHDGRHLVAASSPDGLTFFLLNSHFKDRRAHIGVGVRRGESFLIGPTMAIQRWKGFEEPVAQLASRFGGVSGAVTGFGQLRLTDREIYAFARAMAKQGYLKTIEARPAPKALIDGLTSQNGLDVGYFIIGRMRDGNLTAGTAGGRRIKRVRRPDGLFHAGMVAFDLLLAFAQRHRKVPVAVNFEPLRERLIRP